MHAYLETPPSRMGIARGDTLGRTRQSIPQVIRAKSVLLMVVAGASRGGPNYDRSLINEGIWYPERTCARTHASGENGHTGPRAAVGCLRAYGGRALAHSSRRHARVHALLRLAAAASGSYRSGCPLGRRAAPTFRPLPGEIYGHTSSLRVSAADWPNGCTSPPDSSSPVMLLNN